MRKGNSRFSVGHDTVGTVFEFHLAEWFCPESLTRLKVVFKRRVVAVSTVIRNKAAHTEFACGDGPFQPADIRGEYVQRFFYAY